MAGGSELLARFRNRIFGRPAPMPADVRLVVGLGNPGPEYERTRHNVGFLVADRIAEKCRISFDTRKHNAVFGRGSWRGRPLAVAKPTAFMNRSGKPVAALMRHFSLAPQDILVIVDDIHLALGDLRLRSRGGSGGHNGIQDIIDTISSMEFPRLRLGIGREFERGGQSDYVLSGFDEDQKSLIAESVETAAEAGLCFITDGIETAMNRYNRKISYD